MTCLTKFDFVRWPGDPWQAVDAVIIVHYITANPQRCCAQNTASCHGFSSTNYRSCQGASNTKCCISCKTIITKTWSCSPVISLDLALATLQFHWSMLLPPNYFTRTILMLQAYFTGVSPCHHPISLRPCLSCKPISLVLDLYTLLFYWVLAFPADQFH